LKKTVLVMAFFRPGVGKEDINIQQLDTGGQFREKITRIAAEELQITQSCAIALTQGLRDPLEAQVNAHAVLVGVRRGVSGKEMAVATTDLQHETRRGCRQGHDELGAQGGEAAGPDRLEHFSWHGSVKG